jgi:hypothetical protein
MAQGLCLCMQFDAPTMIVLYMMQPSTPCSCFLQIFLAPNTSHRACRCLQFCSPGCIQCCEAKQMHK